jgi:hypothetical protein
MPKLAISCLQLSTDFFLNVKHCLQLFTSSARLFPPPKKIFGGGYYTSLKEQYIIFLCPMDIFGRGFPAYHFENRAREDFSVTLNDRTFKNFYIFKKYEDFKDPVIKAYMKLKPSTTRCLITKPTLS